ncbi:ATP-binding protein [Candidatus Saccharibacteria bacterium]|nr:ATP-binding protein [Candidatus Saccharibacteria bacterium]
MIKRESYLAILRSLRDINAIKVITGVRRSGKSVLMESFRDELREAVADNVIYYNLEAKENDIYLSDPDALYYQIKAELSPRGINYVFIDEVQMVPEFERMLDSLFIMPNVDLYVTGSNAYMLSSDLATFLTGRYVEIKMQPLSFAEFSEFVPELTDNTLRFQKYMEVGGFPECANMLAQDAEAGIPLYLQGSYQTIREKDIQTRKNLRTMEDFRKIYLYCLDNIGSLTSPNNIANVLEAARLNIDRKTVDEYLGSLMDCFLIYRADRYDIRGKNILRAGSKYYSVDLGLVHTLLGRSATADFGHHLENIVYLELCRRYQNVMVGKNYDREIDFVVKNAEGEREYYQVAQSIASPETLEREMASIRSTGDYYRRTILTMDPFDASEKGIRCRNLITWLLEGEANS